MEYNKSFIVIMMLFIMLVNVLQVVIFYDDLKSNTEIEVDFKGNVVEGVKNFTIKFKKTINLALTILTGLVGFVIFLQNQNPEKTMAWLLILFVLPVLGIVLYMMMGQNIRKNRKFKRKMKKMPYELTNIGRGDKHDFNTSNDDLKKKAASLIFNTSEIPVTFNNSTKVLTNGEETFEEIKSALKKAKSYIHLEYYILKSDEIGNEIKDILVEKLKEGIEVKIIYDAVGSRGLSRKFRKEIKNQGGKIKAFFPVVFPFFRSEVNYRNHRKIIVIDGQTGFVGGLNIGDEYLGRDKSLGFWRDTHLRIDGESVYELENIFIRDWNICCGENINSKKYFKPIDIKGDKAVQIVPSGPDCKWDAIMQVYFMLITSAKKRVWIITPYLIPDESVKMALKTAALSGVDVRIIVPKKSDHAIAHWASRANVEDFLGAGVKIYEYKKGFVHSKIMIVDEDISTIGTANLDYRSLMMHFEVNAFIYDLDVVNKLSEDYLKDQVECDEILMYEFSERPLTDRITESFGKLISPIL